MSKIFLEWGEPFWTSSPFALTLAWTEEEIAATAPEEDWTKGVFSFVSVDGHPRLLLCWVVGPHARIADNKSNQEVKISCV